MLLFRCRDRCVSLSLSISLSVLASTAKLTWRLQQSSHYLYVCIHVCACAGVLCRQEGGAHRPRERGVADWLLAVGRWAAPPRPQPRVQRQWGRHPLQAQARTHARARARTHTHTHKHGQVTRGGILCRHHRDATRAASGTRLGSARGSAHGGGEAGVIRPVSAGQHLRCLENSIGNVPVSPGACG